MLQKLFNPEWQITSKSFLLSTFLIGFSFSPTAEISRLELEFEESLPRKIASISKRGLNRSQMEQPIKKNKFSYFARSRLRLRPQEIRERDYGQMLRAHFKHSQFIVVSLKDGMFNNAIVLFKTKFVDGVSTVTRYAQCQPSRDGDGGGALGRGGKSTAKKNPNKRLRADAPSQPLTPSQG